MAANQSNTQRFFDMLRALLHEKESGVLGEAGMPVKLLATSVAQ